MVSHEELKRWLRDSAARAIISKHLGTRSKISKMTDNMIEWQPIWTLNRATGRKCLLRILFRLKGDKIFTEFEKNSISPEDSFKLEDLMSYLQDSCAKKINPHITGIPIIHSQQSLQYSFVK